MVTATELAPVTFQYSHVIGRQEVRSGNGFFNPVAITRDDNGLLYVLSRGTETPAFFPCKRVTVFHPDEEEVVAEFGQKIPPEDADETTPNGSFMWPTSVALDSQGYAYVSDEWLNRISVYDQEHGNWIGMWGNSRRRAGRDQPAGGAGVRQERQPVHGGEPEPPGFGVHQGREVPIRLGRPRRRRRPVQPCPGASRSTTTATCTWRTGGTTASRSLPRTGRS